MRILWWNAYRLGGGSDLEAYSDYISRRLLPLEADCHIFCEITSDFSLELAGESVDLQKQGARAVRSKARRPYQLGYAAFDANGEELDLNTVEIPGFKKSKRHVVKVDIAGINLYAYHANSSDEARTLVPLVRDHLNDLHADHFVLVGDFNCLPEMGPALEDAPMAASSAMATFPSSSSGKTSAPKALDWAFVKGVGSDNVTVIGRRGNPSDHEAIVFDIAFV